MFHSVEINRQFMIMIVSLSWRLKRCKPRFTMLSS